jgi:signal transduction histidine kinase
MGRSPLQAPVSKSRAETNRRLSSEREQADRALREKAARTEEHIDRRVERVRAQVDTALSAATVEAGATAAAPAAQPSDERWKAQASVELVSERAEEALVAERQRVDELTHREREQRKIDYLDVLREERRETDMALHQEREHSDFTVRNRDDTLAMIAHDLRNFLHAIGLKAQLLGKAPPSDRTRARTIAVEIAQSCQIMERWANDLVDISSMDTGAVFIERCALDPAEIVDAACRAFASAAAASGVKLSTRVPKKIRRALGDRSRLLQVLNNLLDNALKFTPGPGTIVVALEEAGELVKFSVSDTGPGIAGENQSRVFDRYWHGRRGDAAGTGLGLFICKRIVEAHGGQIAIESQSGKGTTVLFTIPAA